jgi:hypothetical protein
LDTNLANTKTIYGEFFKLETMDGFLLLMANRNWKYKDPLLDHTLAEFFTVAIVFSSVTLLFLDHYPKSFFKQAVYIAMWVAIFTGIGYIFHLLGSIVYYNKWNVGWSAVHNTYQFILLRLHYKKPLFAWIGAFIVLIAIMTIFSIPLKN